MKVTLIRCTSRPVDTIEQAASTCYHSDPTPDGRIMRACYRNRHQSVLEHASFTFRIEGVSRAMMAQLTRHRLASFSVESQRYVNSQDCQMVTPPTIESANDDAKAAYIDALLTCQHAYRTLVNSGIPCEDARYIMPNACATNIVMTVNLRELIHLCNERLCSRAQWEIRQTVQAMVDEVNKATCSAFAEFLVPKCEADKKYPVCTESKKDTCGRHPRMEDIYQK